MIASINHGVHCIRVCGLFGRDHSEGRPQGIIGETRHKSAYHIVPVHPEDRQFLGMQWKGKLFIDTALPFGLRSAPKLFNALADALEWIMRSRGLWHVAHYLDDFITVGSPESDECANTFTWHC